MSESDSSVMSNIPKPPPLPPLNNPQTPRRNSAAQTEDIRQSVGRVAENELGERTRRLSEFSESGVRIPLRVPAGDFIEQSQPPVHSRASLTSQGDQNNISRNSPTSSLQSLAPALPPTPNKSKKDKNKSNKKKVKKPSKKKKKDENDEERYQRKLKINYSILISGTETESDVEQDEELDRYASLSPDELSVFKAVEGGDIEETKTLLATLDFDFNKRNKDGYTILHVSIRRENEEMVDVILREGLNNIWGSVLEDALLHGIKEDNLDIVRRLLVEIDGRGLLANKETLTVLKNKSDFKDLRKKFKDHETYWNSEFEEDTTPLLLSAQIDSYQLVSLFHDRGHEMRKPHFFACPCDECLSIGQVRKAYRRFHLYEARTKPAYLCYLANKNENFDLILQCFTLIDEVRSCGKEDIEFKSNYNRLADDLEEFTCSIIEQCRRSEEVEVLLKRKEGYEQRSPFKRLSMAIDLELKKFVAHRHSQQILYKYWAGKSWPSWRSKGLILRCLHGLIRLILWPFISIWLIFEQKSGIAQLFACPASRSLNHMASYLYFLLILFFVNTEEKSLGDRGPPALEIWIPLLFWIIGFWFSFIGQALSRHKSFFSSAWAFYDLLTLLLFSITFILWLVAGLEEGNEPKVIRKYWDPYSVILFAEASLGISSVFAYAKLIRIFQLDMHIGPLITAVGEMIFDLFSVIIFFLIIIFSYSLGLMRLYWAYNGWEDIDKETGESISQSEAFMSYTKSFENLFWSIFGLGSSDFPLVIPRTITDIHNSSHQAINHLTFTENTGKLIYTSYQIVISIILLNMLLGLMSHTYERITSNVDVEWKYVRSKLWLSYGLDFVNPSPLNIIPTLPCCFTLLGSNAFNPPLDQIENSKVFKEPDYFILIRILVQRYFRDEAEIIEEEDVTAQDLETVLEDISELRNLVEVRMSHPSTQSSTSANYSKVPLQSNSSYESVFEAPQSRVGPYSQNQNLSRAQVGGTTEAQIHHNHSQRTLPSSPAQSSSSMSSSAQLGNLAQNISKQGKIDRERLDTYPPPPPQRVENERRASGGNLQRAGGITSENNVANEPRRRSVTFDPKIPPPPPMPKK